MITPALAAACLTGLSTWCALRAPVRRGPLALPSIGLWQHPLTLVVREMVQPTPASYSLHIAVLTSALATELRSGRPPDDAWRHVVRSGTGDMPGCAVPEADIVQVMDRWARCSGWGGLRAVAVCWRLADTTGAGLADALDRIGEAMRHEHEIESEVHGQLAVTRATTVVLATLPLLALAIGSLLGADLLTVLLRTPVGLACLVVGLALTALGTWWVTQQVANVRRVLRW